MSVLGKLFQSNGADRVVGIDIGSSAIKVVELEDRKGVLTLTTYGEIQLGPYVGKQIGESVKLEPKQEQEALVDVIRESAVQAHNAVFAMPLSSSFVTNVSIEADADADLSSMVRVEARKVIPASLSEVTLDWAELELPNQKDAAKESTERNVLIAAIQNQALERFKVLMKFVGIENPPTEIECFSAIRGLYRSDVPTVAIIDIGAVSTKLYVTHNGLLVRMYRIRAGGNLATKRIAEMLEVDFDTAEKLKFSVQEAPEEKAADIKRAHHSSYDRAFREFGQVLREYEQRSGTTFGTVLLSGGGAQFPGMGAHLKESIGREVVLANPFAKVAYPAFMDDNMHAIGPSFSVALGAALRYFE